ncbi:MAG: 4-hydroxy-tetrahydrodipicolinate reductase [Bacteroidales bacterium]|jgi:4-hydroxy-tetrahydrodipicolinate reductase|nr:4-hydroxy-tetrahydrodipicolinate reductase [Bacteroidales bacterium]
MTKIAIIGYGKMGKMVEQAVNQMGSASVVVIIDNEADWEQQLAALAQCDVAIEFSTPQTVRANLLKCFELQIPVVCGTTGWHAQLAEIRAAAQQRGQSLIYGSNFCIGANLFFKLNELLAHCMNKQSQYEVMLEETHHATKVDAPSGTAITTAQVIMEQLERKKRWALHDDGQVDTLIITARRIGEVSGIHAVNYESDEDIIQITHTAKSRIAFARGAVKAALWLPRHAGIYEFKDIFEQV